MINRKLLFCTGLMVLLSCVLFAQQSQAAKMRIAVMDFQANNVSIYAAKAVSETLSTEIARKNDLQVIERSQMGMILREQGFQMTGCTDSACAVQAGRLLSAKKILVGTVSKLGSLYSISTRVVDVESGSVDFAESERCTKEENIDSASRILAIKLLNRITGKDYSLPRRTYQTEEERNRFFVGLGGRIGFIKGVKIPALSKTGSIESIECDATFKTLTVSTGYDITENWVIRLDFDLDYIKMENLTAFIDGSTFETEYANTCYNKDIATAYSLSVNVQYNYPLGGFIPFVSIGVGARKYFNTSDSFREASYMYNGGGANHYTETLTLSSNDSYSAYGILKIGVSIHVSRFVELQLYGGVDYPFASEIYKEVEVSKSTSYENGTIPSQYRDYAERAQNNYKGNNPPAYYAGAMAVFRLF